MCDNLKKVYPGRDGNPEKFAVKGLSLAVPRGECFGMLGPNGAGKTSFISMVRSNLQVITKHFSVISKIIKFIYVDPIIHFAVLIISWINVDDRPHKAKCRYGICPRSQYTEGYGYDIHQHGSVSTA